MSPSQFLSLGLASLLVSAGSSAETIYRWVDKDGSVSFSTAPPPGIPQAGITTIEVTPGPQAAEQQAAEERLQQIKDAADRMEEERAQAKQNRQQRVAKAEDDLRKAQADLARAQVQTPEDWQTIAGNGGRYLKPSYFDRVRAAQEVVAKAQDRLAQAQREAR